VSEAITLAAITPANPLVLVDAGFISTLVSVETAVAALKITDAPSAQQAADLQIRLTTAGRKLEEARKTLKQPFIDKGNEIDAAARIPQQRITAAKDALKKRLTDFEAEQAKAAEEAEHARLKELDRLEQLRRKEEAEAQRFIGIAERCAAKFRGTLVDELPKLRPLIEGGVFAVRTMHR
jgi:hypothetical protein